MTIEPEKSGCRRALGVGWLVLGTVVLALPTWDLSAQPPDPPPPAPPPPTVVLLTLDTTRADSLGAWGGGSGTPVLDALAGAGTRWAQALTPAPLTLPAHTSLLTGLEPPEHGVRDNGTTALGSSVPTLATVLSGRGWATGAFVASRVLDRRFGLARGFDVYDDQMAAERVGEYGYPERDAAAVTSAALDWLEGQPRQRPVLLWVHYYDPHAPYEPPAPFLRGSGSEDRYAAEVAYMDRQIGRLLEGVRRRAAEPLVAAVGDHGEALGEHGERTHGIFLYRPSLEVPLILAGPGVAAGRVVEEAVSIRRLATTLLWLLGVEEALPGAGPVLPGLPRRTPGGASRGDAEPPPEPVYSEARLPATAYGWSPLTALSNGKWRLIRAPRPELYDRIGDPGETRNLITGQRREARRLREALEAREAGFQPRKAAAPPADEELAASLRALGYLSGASGERSGSAALDPKDGIALLSDFERAKELLRTGRIGEARTILESLVAKSPGNVPFLTHLGGARLESGDAQGALAAHREAVELNPRLEFLHLNLAQTYRRLGRTEEARREYELVLEIDPRSASAWFSLAELAHLSGHGAEEKRLLTRAAEAGTGSAVILARLGQVEMAGDPASAEKRLREATELAPGWAMPWLLLGKVRLDHGDVAGARGPLERAMRLAPGGPEEREARRLLATLPPPATP